LPDVTIPAGTKIVNASLCGVWDILYTLQVKGAFKRGFAPLLEIPSSPGQERRI
jgi:hypothetical protein